VISRGPRRGAVARGARPRPRVGPRRGAVARGGRPRPRAGLGAAHSPAWCAGSTTRPYGSKLRAWLETPGRRGSTDPLRGGSGATVRSAARCRGGGRWIHPRAASGGEQRCSRSAAAVARGAGEPARPFAFCRAHLVIELRFGAEHLVFCRTLLRRDFGTRLRQLVTWLAARRLGAASTRMGA